MKIRKKNENLKSRKKLGNLKNDENLKIKIPHFSSFDLKLLRTFLFCDIFVAQLRLGQIAEQGSVDLEIFIYLLFINYYCFDFPNFFFYYFRAK